MKLNLSNIKNALVKKAYRGKLTVQKYSPEILLGAGIVGFVGTVVLACTETLRAEDVIEYHDEKMSKIREARAIVMADPENELEYTDKQYRQDVAFQYVRTGVKFVKLYAPSIALGAVSLACILTSRNILHKRYLGAVSAYTAVSGAFEEYRKRVRDEYGEQLDNHFRYGTEYSQNVVTTVDEDGKKTKVKEEVANIDKSAISVDETARFFDESNRYWDKHPTLNMMFLKGRQTEMNDLLHTRGHLFLNEVYDALGFEHTPQGALLGWVDNEDGDGFVDFGLYDQNKDSVRRFVNGADNVVLLDFNHDGVIYDKI